MRIRPLAGFALFGALGASALAQDVPMNEPNGFGKEDNNTAQSETNHAVTANGILAAWNDARQFAKDGTMFTSQVHWRYSTDWGASFTGGGYFTVPSSQCLTDPAVIADGQGFFYLAAVALADTGRQNIAVARSTGNTAPFGFNPPVIRKPVGSLHDLDKELMAIDRTGGNFNDRIYISATEIGLPRNRIVVAHTKSPGALNFSDWQFVSPSDISATGSMPAVAPNGDVYVIWTAGETILQIVKSEDGGCTFANPDPSDPPPVQTIAKFALPRSLESPYGDIKIVPLAQIAVDSTGAGSPTRGNVYVVFAADPDVREKGDKADIYFTRSTNGGASWTAPRSITSGLAAALGQDPTKNDSWMPSITVSPVNGHIYVTFYDRRGDTTCDDGDPVNTKTRVFRALSTDGGLTWANAPLGTATFVPIPGFPTVLEPNDPYWGEYNWSTSDTAGLHFTWGDSRNLCNPPTPSPPESKPCSPPGRPDLDAYYHTTANLSGADLFIQPWGAVTGIGPAWQTPDVFVVNASGNVVNARKGLVNRLRARVRNLGNAKASHVVVRFRYAPWFAGVNDSLLKETGAVHLNFPVAGRAGDTQIAKIGWDLTNLGDTNGGRWPAPVGEFQHFCVKVTVEFAGDINLSNNAAQNNFVDVANAASPASGPLDFMIVGPDKRLDPRTRLAQIQISKLPEGFGASVSLRGGGDPEQGFLLEPNQIRLAQVKFAAPKDPKLPRDVVADVTLLLGGKPAGGISARLYRSPGGPGDLHGIGPVTAAYWDVKPPVKPPDQPSTPGFELPPRPPRVIPEGVKYRRVLAASYEDAIGAALASFKEQPAVVNRERGLINSHRERLTAEQIRGLVVAEDLPRVTGDGYAIVSIYFQPLSENETEVGAASLIAVDDESPLGRVLTSNGTLEKSYLEAVMASHPSVR